jgi:hypothetical protein
MPDAEIDYSDIPWTRPGALVPSENKEQITLRLDADVLTSSREPASATRAASMPLSESTSQAHKKSA